MQTDEKFSVRLAEAMRKRGLKQSALAARMEVSQSTVNRWLQGAVPQPRAIRPLCAALSVRKKWLVEGHGEMEPDEREKALHPSWAGGQSQAQSGLHEEPVPYGASAEAERLHREIMQRLDDASLSTDEVAQEVLKRRLEEYIAARKSKLH